MCGLFIQLGARDKRQRRQHIDNLLTSIQATDSLNKQQPHPNLKNKLLKLHLELRSLLFENFDKLQKRLKMHFYASGNRARTFLANQIKGHHIKTHILYLYHPATREKLLNPQDIADAFSTFYGTLYNFKD